MIAKTLLLIALTLSIINTQEPVCDLPVAVIPTNTESNNANVTLVNDRGIIVGTWVSPKKGDTVIITLGSWTSTNGNLKVAFAIGQYS
jgi:hypothetical protein